MKRITLEYYGVDGSGATVKEAKEDAGRKIQAAFRGLYEPIFLHWQNSTRIVWRDATHGWKSGWLILDGKWRDHLCGGGCGGHGQEAKEEEIASSVYCLAQNHWQETTTDSDVWKMILDPALRRRKQSDWQSCVRYYRAYKAAPAELSENAKHEWACHHSHQFAA